MFKVIFLFVLVVEAFGFPSRVDPSLNKVLETKGTANVFVSFTAGTARVLNSFHRQVFSTRTDKLNALNQALEKNAAKSQKRVLSLLANRDSGSYQSFWINNQVYIHGASPSLVQQIGQLPEVAEVFEEEIFELLVPVEIIESQGPFTNDEEWGVSIIQAPEAWGLDGGNNGENVRVGIIDTGARYTHEAIKDNFVGDFGWFDPSGHTLTPNDGNGHGTHVTGTIAGQGGIGVAPGCKWLACKGCASFSCSQFDLISCGQFMVCPTNPTGEEKDCSKAPHAVSNSWGGGQGRPMYHEVIAAWKEAGIVGLFANGNSGPRCGTANSPADHPDIIGVGSTTIEDALSTFSSVGPSVFNTLKPDVTAPGSAVRSSYNTGDTAYAVLSGTSMACPHAAGVVALLKGRDQDLSLVNVTRHLTKGIDRDVINTGKTCGGIPDTEWPNYHFGMGRVNALKSLLSLLEES